MAKPKLLMVLGSTRPGRLSPAVAAWLAQIVEDDGRFEGSIADLAEFNLPLFNEPKHPMLASYEHDHTKAWSAAVASSDALVLITPEYNHGYPAVLKNALDYLHVEWKDKPVGFVSYGGVSGGTRAVGQLKAVVSALRMTAVVESVIMPMIGSLIVDGELPSDSGRDGSAVAMLAELQRKLPQSG
jgi:NAD(P)H-dependent FMN reductase